MLCPVCHRYVSRASWLKNGHTCKGTPRNTCAICGRVFKHQQDYSKHCASCRMVHRFQNEDTAELQLRLASDVRLRVAVEDSILNAISLVHFNSDYPLNMNVKKTNIKNDEILLWQGRGWHKESYKLTVDKLTHNLMVKLGLPKAPDSWAKVTAADMRSQLKRQLVSTNEIAEKYETQSRELHFEVASSQNRKRRKVQFDENQVPPNARVKRLSQDDQILRLKWHLP